MASFPLNVIRRVFSAGEVVAPQLAGLAAFELFRRTPASGKLSAGERKAVERAAAFMAEARRHWLPTRSGCVVAYEFRPAELGRRGRAERNTVLVVHGWRSRTEYMVRLITAFREAGFRVVSLDFPGHGASPGRRLDMARAVAAMRSAADWFGPFAAVVGHSFGGAVAINAAVGAVDGLAPVQTDRIVTIASPSSMPDLFASFGRTIGLGPRTQAVVNAQVQRVTGRPLSEFETGYQLRALPQSVLVIHDDQDNEVPLSEAQRAASAGDHVELYVTSGLGHRRILSDEGVIAKAVEFVADRRLVPALH